MDFGIGEVNNVKRHVLVVDDDSRMLHAVKSYLQDTYEVKLVKSGMEALQILKKEIPDVILLDYEMPVMSGCKVLERIRENEATKDIPVFFLTGLSDKKTVLSAIRLSPQGYILKSTSKEEILNRLEQFFLQKDMADLLSFGV